MRGLGRRKHYILGTLLIVSAMGIFLTFLIPFSKLHIVLLWVFASTHGISMFLLSLRKDGFDSNFILRAFVYVVVVIGTMGIVMSNLW